MGLGNPGPEYADTRHNIGFKVAELLAEQGKGEWKSGRFGLVAEVRFKNKTATVIKPDTYMNLSGGAARHWLNALKLTPAQLLVVTDDLALPYGKIRFRPKGSHGGHNGLRSISEVLGTDDYPRLRFGIGADFSKGKQVDYVLGRWNAGEQKTIEENIARAAEAVQTAMLEGIEKAMSLFNR